jgi:Holliday junction DNA helicase RuvA
VFNSLRGTITHKGNNIVWLATGGVEWEINTTGNSLARLGAEGSEGTMFVYLYHREDAMKLFGFATVPERELFFELIKIEGVGPKLAQKILSSIAPGEFAAAVEREDLGALESLPGLGKKTAQKIVFHLKGKLPRAGEEAGGGDLTEDLVNALVGMGFDKKASREAVARAVKDTAGTLDALSNGEREQAVFKLALALVSKEGRKS